MQQLARNTYLFLVNNKDGEKFTELPDTSTQATWTNKSSKDSNFELKIIERK